METYWSILEKVKGSSLRLTKIDDDILAHLKKDFPEFNPAVPRVGTDPDAIDLGPSGDSPAFLCADRGWREPGWSATYTVPVSAAGLAPGEYRLTWARTPEIPLLDLSVVAP